MIGSGGHALDRSYESHCNEAETTYSIQHQTARAHLCKYLGGNGKEGLMTADGHMVTLPEYDCIEAVGPDTYICTISNDDKVMLNGEGKMVR